MAALVLRDRAGHRAKPTKPIKPMMIRIPSTTTVALAMALLSAATWAGPVSAQSAGVPSIQQLEKKLEQKRKLAEQAAAGAEKEALSPAAAKLSLLAGPLVSIPAGPMRMGDIVGNGRRDERPVHNVQVAAFVMGKTEVTRGQFAAFVKATGYLTDAERDAGRRKGCLTHDYISNRDAWRPGYSWRDPGFPQTDAHPVVCVSWNDAQAFIQWLNRETARTFRLPSETEWEYAARARNVAQYPWGMDVTQGCKYANSIDRTAKPNGLPRKRKIECTDGYYFTAPVATLLPNEFGLNDMIGNVEEWNSDCYHRNYIGAPSNGAAWTSNECSSRLMRGGSWGGAEEELRSSYRQKDAPTYRNVYLGFRIAEGG